MIKSSERELNKEEKFKASKRRPFAKRFADLSALDPDEVLDVLMSFDDEDFVDCVTNEFLEEYMDGQGYDLKAP